MLKFVFLVNFLIVFALLVPNDIECRSRSRSVSRSRSRSRLLDSDLQSDENSASSGSSELQTINQGRIHRPVRSGQASQQQTPQVPLFDQQTKKPFVRAGQVNSQSSTTRRSIDIKLITPKVTLAGQKFQQQTPKVPIFDHQSKYSRGGQYSVMDIENASFDE